ncbi:Ras-specific guanine nucleotide-releasing factor 1, partial [Taenia solium]
MLLPMLGVYQEYVRNHHYSLQVLAEYKMKEEFTRTLKRCEEKSQCEGRSIESFLTSPMYQIPRYLVTLHEILAHTPHEHVDRTNLEYAKRKLETLSQVIHDEVSDTENIRKNLAIERMISDGCDILLDANQVTMNKAIYPCPRITQLSSSSCEKKERLRQVFLFTNHLLIATRINSGRLKLAKKNGKIPLQGCTLVEEMPFDLSQDESVYGSPPPTDTPESGPSPVSGAQSVCSFGGQEELSPTEPQQHQQPTPASPPWNLIPAKLAHGSLMLAALTLGTTGGKSKRETRPGSFTRKIVADDSGDDSPAHITSMMSTSSAANPDHHLRSYGNLVFQITWPGDGEGASSIWLVASNLQEKEAWCSDISQCIEQLHYSDMLSIAHSEVSSISMPYSVRLDPGLFKDCPDIKYRSTRNSCKMPQVRHGTLGRLLDRLLDPRFQSIDYLNTFLLTYRVFTTGLTIIAVLRCVLRDPSLQLASTKINLGLFESMLRARPGTRCAKQHHNDSFLARIKGGRRVSTGMLDVTRHQTFVQRQNLVTENVLKEEEHESGGSESEEDAEKRRVRSASEDNKSRIFRFPEASEGSSEAGLMETFHDSVEVVETPTMNADYQSTFMPNLPIIERHSVSTSAPSILENAQKASNSARERGRTSLTRQRSHVSYACDMPIYRRPPKAGAIITSARLSRRRSSNWAAVKAFAIATAASGSTRVSHHERTAAIQRSPLKTAIATNLVTSANTVVSTPHLEKTPPTTTMASIPGRATLGDEFHFLRLTSPSTEEGREAVVAGMTVLRVLNVARHWITKYPEDFDCDALLKSKMQVLLEELLHNPRLNVSNRKVAFQLSKEMLNDQLVECHVPSKEDFDTIPALDIAEELTYLDFHIFRSIKTQELLNQVWMKDGKETKAPHVMLVTKRFNEVSKLVVSEIITRSEISDRAACIEKWIAIADICRCLQNYNGVLQICAALENSSVHRLKATWDVVSKQSKQSFDKLLTLVAANARFKNMRERLHRCDPPCIPYLGMYLTDLSFIEEGALDITEHGLINFCKMRMLAHVLMEIRRYTQTPYMIKLRQEV